MQNDKPNDKPHGGFNLLLLGVISIAIAAATTGISLAIYHNSGDIYLDRSRPGFLPDDDEISGAHHGIETYDLDKTGAITPAILDKYLDALEKDAAAIDAYEKPFSADVLSDEHLGITELAE